MFGPSSTVLLVESAHLRTALCKAPTIHVYVCLHACFIIIQQWNAIQVQIDYSIQSMIRRVGISANWEHVSFYQLLLVLFI